MTKYHSTTSQTQLLFRDRSFKEHGFILPIVLSIILIITLLAVSSTDVLRIDYRIEQSKDRQHIALQRAKQTLSGAETYLEEIQEKPDVQSDVSRDTLDPLAPVFWDANLADYALLEEEDQITKKPLSHYVQNRHWWSTHGNPVLSTENNQSKAIGYATSEENDFIGYFIIEDFDEVIEQSQISQPPDYHMRPGSKLYGISTFGDFDQKSSSRIQSFYIKNFY